MANAETSQDTIAKIACQSPRIGRRARITGQDVESMAKLVVTRRMTETEAMSLLGIHPRSWWKWKERQANQGKNAAVLERTRAAYIHAQIANMEDASIGAGPHKRADWRASDRLLGIVDPLRYGQQQQQDQGRALALPSIVVNVWTDLASTCTSQGQAQVIDALEVKAIDDHKPE